MLLISRDALDVITYHHCHEIDYGHTKHMIEAHQALKDPESLNF